MYTKNYVFLFLLMLSLQSMGFNSAKSLEALRLEQLQKQLDQLCCGSSDLYLETVTNYRKQSAPIKDRASLGTVRMDRKNILQAKLNGIKSLCEQLDYKNIEIHVTESLDVVNDYLYQHLKGRYSYVDHDLQEIQGSFGGSHRIDIDNQSFKNRLRKEIEKEKNDYQFDTDYCAIS